jgi:hypothetical protein
MDEQQLSRFITYPSVVDKSNNHTVILIDATAEELIRLERFLKTSDINFDVYLYPGHMGDLEWLNHVSYHADQTLINNDSEVSTSNSTRYGLEQPLKEPLAYFEQYELDNKSNLVL